MVHALVAKGVSVVAITRNPNSKKAQELATLRRVELRKGDLNNQKSLEAAFSGCDGAFVPGTDNRTTGRWKYENMKKQYENCAAALKCIDGMKHVVISATEFLPAQEVFNGKGLPTTYVHTGLNVVNTNFVLKLGDDGHYGFPLPAGNGPIAWTVMKDLGNMVAGVFQRPSMIGPTVGCASFHCTADQLANHMSTAIGMKIKCLKLPAFIWEKVCADIPANFADIANFCQFFGNQEAQKSILATRDLNICKELAGGKLADPVEELRDMHRGVTQAGNFKFRRCIGVLGASGKQGCAVVRALSQQGKHSVIALVRDDRSSLAKELATLPRVEVRKIKDMTHGGHEGAMEAFKGCDSAFLNAADPKDAGKVVVMHQKIAGGLTQLGTMKHVVMSTMEEAKNTLRWLMLR